MRPQETEWPSIWVWRGSAHQADGARVAVLTGGHLFVTAPRNRREIAQLHEAAPRGSEAVLLLVGPAVGRNDDVIIERSTITSVLWNSTTRSVEIGHGGDLLTLRCREAQSAEELGRGLHRELAPSTMPVSSNVRRREVITFELTRGKGFRPLLICGAALAVLLVAAVLSWGWVAIGAIAVAAVSAVMVASIVRDARRTVPCYRVAIPASG